MPENEKPTSIFRISKNPENPYVMIDRRPIHNKGLSLKAKGLLTIMLCFPDGWDFNFKHLVSLSTDGESGTRTTMRELIAARHVVMEQGRVKEAVNAGKFQEVTYLVYELPLGEKPQAVQPQAVKPRVSSNKKASSNEVSKELVPAKKTGTTKKKDNTPWQWEDEPEPMRSFGLAFEKLIDRRPLTRGEMALWKNGRPNATLFGFKHFIEIGATVALMQDAYSLVDAMPHVTIKNPNSIWFKVDDLRRKANQVKENEYGTAAKTYAEKLEERRGA